MFEPDLTGFSYSFTDDGHYEEAYYRAISNRTSPNPHLSPFLSLPFLSFPCLSFPFPTPIPFLRLSHSNAIGKLTATDPNCPQGIIQWQHGTYTKNTNGSLSLKPIGVDGRQLLSDPCNYANSVYTRYNQSELFKSYQVLTDAYSKAQRLNLFAFDGAPLNPMYLAYQPPQMLPTQTLNPTSSATGGGQASSTGSSKLKKRFHGGDEHIVDDSFNAPLSRNALVKRRPKAAQIDADKWWWIGVGMTALGGIGYFCF